MSKSPSYQHNYDIYFRIWQSDYIIRCLSFVYDTGKMILMFSGHHWCSWPLFGSQRWPCWTRCWVLWTHSESSPVSSERQLIGCLFASLSVRKRCHLLICNNCHFEIFNYWNSCWFLNNCDIGFMRKLQSLTLTSLPLCPLITVGTLSHSSFSKGL